MNRAIVFGIAIFFAIVGIALLGGESTAVAGHGCHGCAGDCGGCGGDCGAACDCGGCHGCHGRRRHRHRRRGCCGCAGYVADCCAPAPACDGGHVPGPGLDDAPAPPPAPAAFNSDRAPHAFQKVAFRR